MPAGYGSGFNKVGAGSEMSKKMRNFAYGSYEKSVIYWK